jgi:hypothetical protein
MLDKIVNYAKLENRNILIIGAPRSGTHAFASIIHQSHPELNYLGEIGLYQKHPEPWKDFELFYDNTPKKLAHVSQSYSKLFALLKVSQLKKNTLIVEIRRRNKIKQFASWMFFKKIGAIYNFQHDGQDYMPPGSITVTLNDIESFIIDQIIDCSFSPDYTLYYEEIAFDQSRIKKNHYIYPIEQVFSNLDLVEEYLGNWKYND